MKDLEKQIEEAALEYCEDFSHTPFWWKVNTASFENGAKSEAAKEYWQQGMYSEEETKTLVLNAILHYQDWMLNKLNGVNSSPPNMELWFEQNKKK